MKNTNFFLVNTCCSKHLKGNPTPIYILESYIPNERMEVLAAEMNMPVSVFLYKSRDQDVYNIRYFTKTGEIEACGHGTLGAAYVLFSQYQNTDKITFKTIEDLEIICAFEEEITFVEYPKFELEKTATLPKINTALGIKSHLSYFYCKALESLFIELRDEYEVQSIQPNFDDLIRATNTIKEVVVMSKALNQHYDYVLRSFCPWIGIDEDPVTGSIHSVLGHFMQEQLNKNSIIVKQASERGGQLIIKPLEDKVKIGGDCDTLIEGHIRSPYL
ncbi:MAG: PhzF family phenazine biosynthesis isomerase [Bacteroidota bacterium]